MASEVIKIMEGIKAILDGKHIKDLDDMDEVETILDLAIELKMKGIQSQAKSRLNSLILNEQKRKSQENLLGAETPFTAIDIMSGHYAVNENTKLISNGREITLRRLEIPSPTELKNTLIDQGFPFAKYAVHHRGNEISAEILCEDSDRIQTIVKKHHGFIFKARREYKGDINDHLKVAWNPFGETEIFWAINSTIWVESVAQLVDFELIAPISNNIVAHYRFKDNGRSASRKLSDIKVFEKC